MLRIGILGCDAIKNELEMIIGDDPDVVYREYLEFGLHLRPDELKKVILEKIAALPTDVEVLFLGYAHCQSLKDIPKQVAIPTIMLEYEDCIAAMLSVERYHREKKNKGITWFYPAGWAVNGMDGMVRLFNLDSAKESGYPPEFFLKMMFDGFARCLFIDTGIGCVKECECNSVKFANLLNLQHESMEGSLDLIRDAWNNVKETADPSKPAN